LGVVGKTISGELVAMQLQATVIIPTFEDWDRLNICLDCLAGQSADPALFEVIVANNNPSPEVPASVRLPSNARVIHVAKPGSYAARNAALREARGLVLFFTDSDCQPDRRWIEAGLAAIAPLGPHGRVAGAIELFPKADHWTGPELYDRIFHHQQEEYASRGWGATANLIARRAAFDLAGPFNDDRFSLGDREWNSRATELGSELRYSAEALIRHPARASYAELAKRCKRLAGGLHEDMMRGRRPKVPLRVYLVFLDPWEVRQVMAYPGLTDRQRLQVLWVCLRIGMVSFAETVRLRHFSGKPQRS
jgi:glycosyltransferase involved in cell wall biosynthesis